ncbi:MAG TPA: hypothetical protein VJS64_15205 [Pyrinomonadaceae bacterium]|nr:hypothetical protein [Pyrinomonadaceae bacterium]
MKTAKLIALAIATLMTLVLCNTVQAQKNALVSFKGIEVSAGHEEEGEAYGWMCYARTSGSLTGNFTLSMDYDGTKSAGTNSIVTGGAWTLPVYASSKFLASRPVLEDPYQGVLFGSVIGGDVTWDKYGTATIQLKMLIQGGTQAMTDLRGNAFLVGTLTYGEKLGTFNGTIYFEFQ